MISQFLSQLFHIITYPVYALLYAPSKLFALPRRMLSISWPARGALLTALFLIICLIAAFVAYYSTDMRAAISAKVTTRFIIIVSVLMVAIPLVVYQALKLWLQGDVSRYPDIDYAWRAGVEALGQHGLDLRDVPLFLVLGAADQAQAKAVFDASHLSLRVREVPQGPAALHWYANPEGIYIVCTETCSLSRLGQIAHKISEEAAAQPIAAVARGSRSGGGNIRGTMMMGEPAEAPTSIAQSGPLPTPGPAKFDPAMTMVVASDQPDPGAAQASAGRKQVVLNPQEGAEQEQRLAYLCRLIRQARQPLCPINGVLTLLQFGILARGPREGAQMQAAIKRDLSVMRREFKLRCPVTALVTGLEEESGFRELVRRVGKERSIAQRFGKGYGVWNPPIPEQLEAVCAHACGSFEDWIYSLFREQGALSKPGNTKLYGLLCKIRRNVQSRLANVLVGAYAAETDKEGAEGGGFLFSGCYFAATGDTEDRQAFVKATFEKLVAEQEELQWTDEAIREDQRYRRMAEIGLGIDTLLFLGLGAMILYKIFGR